MERERRYGGLTATERSTARREALLEAGLECFGTVGLANTTIEDLCQSANVGRTAFYEHFAHRDELFGRVNEMVVIETLTQVDAALLTAPTADLTGRANASIQAVLGVLLGDPRKGRIMTREVYTLPSAAVITRRWVHELADLLVVEARALAANQVIPDRDVTTLAIAIVGGVREVIVDQLGAEHPTPIDHLTNDLTFMIVALASSL